MKFKKGDKVRLIGMSYDLEIMVKGKSKRDNTSVVCKWVNPGGVITILDIDESKLEFYQSINSNWIGL